MADKRWKQPRRLYAVQKRKAEVRGIPWEFTFETWWKLWEDSGKWNKRGRRSGQFCMRRRGDIGPYSPDNCYIGEVIENNREGMRNWREKKRIQESKEEKVGECCTAFAKATVEKPKPSITVNQFKPAPMPKEIIIEKHKQEKRWTFAKIVCLIFPSWGPRWLVPNKQ
jgi:hypothetical protein